MIENDLSITEIYFHLLNILKQLYFSLSIITKAIIVLTALSIVIIAFATVLGLIPIYINNRSVATAATTSTIITTQASTNSSSISLSQTVTLQANNASGRKKKQITTNKCNQYQLTLSTICNGLSNFNLCNASGLTSFLQDFTNISVSKKT